jgi:YbbR domain-containing protein
VVFSFCFIIFFSKQLNINVSKAVFKNGHYVIEEALLKKEIDGQLSQNISLLDLDRNYLVIDLYKVDFKEIPIEPKVDIQFQQNFILDGPIVANPKTVVAKGPASDIDSLSKIETILIELNNIGSDFKVDAALNLPDGLKNTNFSVEKVQLSGKAVKFSEEVFRLPVHTINLPSGYTVKTFPNTVSVLCKATVDRLKEISTDDFKVVADYSQVDDTSGNVLYLELKKVPEQVFDIRLHEKTVTFVLEQE